MHKKSMKETLSNLTYNSKKLNKRVVTTKNSFKEVNDIINGGKKKKQKK